MVDKITGSHLEALTLLGGAGKEVRSNIIFTLGQEDLLNAVLDLVEMKIANRRTQPDYVMPGEDEIYYSLSNVGKKYYNSILTHANQVNPSSKRLD